MRQAGDTRHRARRTAAQWRKLIERFDRSGQTRGNFCAANGLALSTFCLTYIANQWEGLLVFLHDGRVEMDTNFVENRIRPVKLTAKICRSLCHPTAGRCNYSFFVPELFATRGFSPPGSPRISASHVAAASAYL